MWDWLGRLFGGANKENPPPPVLAAKPSEVAAAGQNPPPGNDYDWGSGFEKLLSLTGQVHPGQSVLTPEEMTREEELAERVRAHFRDNRPPPSALPSVSLQVLNLVAEPEVGMNELSRVMGQDPAYTAALLKVANSAGFAGGQETLTVRDAVARLGLTEVARVASVVSARSLFQPQVRSEFASFGTRWSDIFAEAVVAARGAAWLSMRIKNSRGDHAFLAGILHDLGRSVALRSVAALQFAEQCFELEGTEIDRVVERVHVEIGTDIHAHWSLPRFPTLVTSRHHDLLLPTDPEFIDVHNVRLVSALVQFRRQSWRAPQIQAEVDESCQVLQLDGFALRSLDTQLRKEMETALASGLVGPRKRSPSQF